MLDKSSSSSRALFSFIVFVEEPSSSDDPPGFSAQQIVPDMQSDVFGINSAGRLQNAPEKKTGIQVPGQEGMGGVVVVISLLKQHCPPFGQYLSLATSSHNRANRGATQVPSQSSMAINGAGVVVVSAIGVVEV